MHYFSMQFYFNLRYPIVLLLDRGEIVKSVYNWLTGENGGGGRLNQISHHLQKARAAPVHTLA